MIILTVTLLFLPLTSATTTPNSNASAQSDLRVYEEERNDYEREVNFYERCLYYITIVNDLGIYYSELLGSSFTPTDPAVCGNPPEPPQPVRPVDCEQLNTCPITPTSPESIDESCIIVPTTLNLHDSHYQSRITFVDYVYVQDPSLAVIPSLTVEEDVWKVIKEYVTAEKIKGFATKSFFKYILKKLLGKIPGSVIVDIFTPSPLAPSDCAPGRCGIPLQSVPIPPEKLICR